MKTKCTVLIFLLIVGAQPVFAVEQAEFCGMKPNISQFGDSRLVKSRLQDYLQNKQIVYVEGLLGSAKTAFRENESLIKTVDSRVPVTKLAPPTKQSVESNARFLFAELQKLAARYPGREFILLGMSKGGAEVVQLAAEQPELFVRGNAHGFLIDAVVPINAAVGGSVLTDLEMARDQELSNRWQTYKRVNNLEDGFLVRQLKLMLKYFLLDTKSEGFRSMATEESAVRAQKLLDHLGEHERTDLIAKIGFVTSVRVGKDSGDIPSYMGPLAGFVMSEDPLNDGILFEKNQIIPSLGRHLLSISKASHFNLTGNYGDGKCRKEFTELLLLKLADRQ